VRTCSAHVKSFTKRGVELERCGFPAMAASLRTLPALFSSLLPLAQLEATRLACDLARWQRLWYREVVA